MTSHHTPFSDKTARPQKVGLFTFLHISALGDMREMRAFPLIHDNTVSQTAMEEFPLIADLALILIAAGCTSILCKLTKLPVIVGYLVAGLLTGPKISLLPTVTDNASISTWSEIGVIFLLFALGLEFNFKSLLKVGKTGATTALAILFGIMLTSLGLGLILDWSTTQSIFMGGMLAISSTMVAVKAFEELGLKGKPFTHIVYGVEVVEDIIAILLLVILPMIALSQSTSLAKEVTSSIARVLFFMSLWFLGGIFLVPTLLRKLKKHLTDELLLILSLALCLGMVSLADKSGLSTALGAFVIGAILGTTTQAHRIETLMQPVKNLFGAIFFVSVGMLADPAVIVSHWGTVLLCILIVVIIQPLMAMTSLILTKHSLNESVHAGLSFGNIGEFSFIIASLGIANGVLEDFVYPVVIVVCVITTITMPNMLKLAKPLENKLEKWMPAPILNLTQSNNDPAATHKTPNRRAVLIKQFAFETAILAVLLIGIISLFSGFIAPHAEPYLNSLLSHNFDDETSTFISESIIFSIMLLCMMPFLSAMIIRKDNMQHVFFAVLLKGGHQNLIRSLQTIRLLIVACFIAYTLIALSPFPWFINAIAGLVVFSLILFFKGIFANYIRLERQFLFNYNEAEVAEQNASRSHAGDELKSFTNIQEGAWLPEDFSVAHIKIDEDSVFLGKTLRDLDLRAKHELFIIRIERADDALNIPTGDTVIELDDTIYIVGKFDTLRALLKDPYNISNKKLHIQSMRAFTNELAERRTDESNLRCIIVPITKNSGLAGKTLRDSDIGLKNKCLVIGLEVSDRVEMNLKADTIFEIGCRLWVVGEDQALSSLLEENIT